MSIRWSRPGKRPFFITPRDDGFRMALIRDGKFIGWRERGTRFASKEAATLALLLIPTNVPLIVGEIV